MINYQFRLSTRLSTISIIGKTALSDTFDRTHVTSPAPLNVGLEDLSTKLPKTTLTGGGEQRDTDLGSLSKCPN